MRKELKDRDYKEKEREEKRCWPSSERNGADIRGIVGYQDGCLRSCSTSTAARQPFPVPPSTTSTATTKRSQIQEIPHPSFHHPRHRRGTCPRPHPRNLHVPPRLLVRRTGPPSCTRPQLRNPPVRRIRYRNLHLPPTNSQNQTPNPRITQSLNDTSSRLGPTMTRLLHTRNHTSDPLLIQLALQSSLTLCTARALSSFIIGLPSKSDLLLSQIYSEMQKGEEQPVFKKWRALTERYVGVFYPTLGSTASAK
jgi:hypothetical protein